MREPHGVEIALGYMFLDESRLREALSQASARNEGMAQSDNRRLAFLGDAVLELAVRDRGYHEGLPYRSLTAWKQDFVKNKEIAKVLEGLDAWILTGRGERGNADGKTKRTATAFEALLGGMYLDCGMHAVRVTQRLVFGK